MGCQTSVAEATQGAKADYVLRVKDNQESLRSDIERLFERRLDRGFKPGYTDVDGGHGRVETRRCWAIDVEGRGLVDGSRWPELQSVALVETERFVAEPQEEAGPVDGETETKRRYLISSLEADAEKILEASRQHWQIENGLHWVLGVPLQGRSQPGADPECSGELGPGKATSSFGREARREGRRGDANQTNAGRPATVTGSIYSKNFEMRSPCLRLSPGLCEGAGRGVARGYDGMRPRRDRLCSLKRPRMRGGIPPGVVTSCSRKRTVCSSPPATSFAKTSTANESLADSASPSHFVVQSLRLPPP